ncbi:MAG: regulatory protein TetR [Rhodoglobus sp.]|nr:regulatory protein TetR [Rhodoglobus sp.]
MGRWEPDARGRLARAALTLYAEQGFDRTTVAEIAEAAGLTESTFFRNFADKREVLFYGAEGAAELLASSIAASTGTPMDAVSAALEAWTAIMQEDIDRVRQRDAVIAANPELQERNLTKHAELAAAMAAALRDRGTLDTIARLTAETGIVVFTAAYARWIEEPGKEDLPSRVRAAMVELRGALAQ